MYEFFSIEDFPSGIGDLTYTHEDAQGFRDYVAQFVTPNAWYKDSPQGPGGGYFLVRNSWSTSWAYDSPYGAGNGTIPYQYIEDDAWEAYSAVVLATGDGRIDGDARLAAGSGTSVVIEVGPAVKITIAGG
jgi:hypothetical protein